VNGVVLRKKKETKGKRPRPRKEGVTKNDGEKTEAKEGNERL